VQGRARLTTPLPKALPSVGTPRVHPGYTQGTPRGPHREWRGGRCGGASGPALEGAPQRRVRVALGCQHRATGSLPPAHRWEGQGLGELGLYRGLLPKAQPHLQTLSAAPRGVGVEREKEWERGRRRRGRGKGREGMGLAPLAAWQG